MMNPTKKDIADLDRMVLEEGARDESAPPVQSECQDEVEEARDAIFRSRFIIRKTNKAGEITSETFDHNKFAKWLLNESGETFAALAHINDLKKSIYRYGGGVYGEGGGAWIERKMEIVMGGKLCTTRNRTEVLGHVRALHTVNIEKFDGDEDIINMGNGLYSISSETLKPHTPKYLSVQQINVEYDPEATCPTIDKFFSQTFESHRVESGYELMGYVLMPRKRMKKSIILLGPSNSGKGTYMRLMAGLVGVDNVSEINPITMANYTHATEAIVGKLMLRVDDLGKTPIVETGLFKSLISAERAHCNPKGGSQFDFWPKALMLFACNAIPMCEDENLMDKIDIVKCVNGRSDEECDTNLDVELASELSGLFNKAMVAVKTAVKNNSFTGSYTLEDRKKDFIYMSNPMARFVDEWIEITCDDWDEVPIETVRGMQVAWGKEQEIRKIQPQKDLTTYLKDRGAKTKKIGPRFEQVPHYTGVQIRSSSVARGSKSANRGGEGDLGVGSNNPEQILSHKSKKEKKVHRDENGGGYGTTEGENGKPIVKPGFTTKNYKETTATTTNKKTLPSPSKPIDLTGRATPINRWGEKSSKSTPSNVWADSNAEQKLQHAVGKAMGQTHRPDVDVVMINEAHPEHPGVSMIVAQLNDRGEALGITKNPKGLYRVTI